MMWMACNKVRNSPYEETNQQESVSTNECAIKSLANNIVESVMNVPLENDIGRCSNAK